MAKTAAEKLGIAPGMTVRIVAAPTEVVALAELPERAHVVGAHDDADAVIVFADDFATLHARFAPEVARATERTLLWVAYRKGGVTELSRDGIRPLFESDGWETVAAVAVDDDWSALRFRPSTSVRRRA